MSYEYMFLGLQGYIDYRLLMTDDTIMLYSLKHIRINYYTEKQINDRATNPEKEEENKNKDKRGIIEGIQKEKTYVASPFFLCSLLLRSLGYYPKTQATR